MPLTIPDELLAQAHLTEQEARVEIACHLYDARRISKAAASRLAGLSRVAFEEELLHRGLPLIRYTEEMFRQDLAAIGPTSEREGGADAGRQ
jgi:predicted HTH domain antitoxin